MTVLLTKLIFFIIARSSAKTRLMENCFWSVPLNYINDLVLRDMVFIEEFLI